MSADIIARLSEEIIADAFEVGIITSGPLAERLIRERADASSEIAALRSALEPWAALGRACDPIVTYIPINAYVPNLRRAAELLDASLTGKGS